MEIITVWLNLTKNGFQAYGADASGRAIFRKKLRRDQVLAFFAQLPAYVKPFIKRQKSDAADEGAICEAAQRLMMRLCP